MSTDKLSKNKNNSVLHAIFEHDVEAAAFIIVSMMLAASVTSYALDTSSVSNTNKRADEKSSTARRFNPSAARQPLRSRVWRRS